MYPTRCGLLCESCSFRESHNCKGCVDSMGHPFHGECPIAVCCQDRGLDHCGQCLDVPCEALCRYSCADPEHGDKPLGQRIRQVLAWHRAEMT